MLALLPESRRRHLVRLALHFWREGESEIQAPHRRASRAAYESAVAALLREMENLTTMEQLLTSYLAERRRLALATERACRAAAPARPISRVWVRDAAFWRRLRQEVRFPLGE